MNQRKRMFNALVYAENTALLSAIPALLSRAGFSVDVITTSPLFYKHRHVRQVIQANSSVDLVEKACLYSKKNYDFIAPCDEAVIDAVLQAQLSDEEKLRLLPTLELEKCSHLNSKIGLSRLLKKNNILTPDFAVANHLSEIKSLSSHIGFPMFVKIDHSSGGAGVYECNTEVDIEKLPPLIYPVLIQKKIPGKLISSGGLFLNKKIIFFEIAEVLPYGNHPLGPSIVRKYRTPTHRDIPVFEQVGALGAALSAHGFVNMSWIESAQQKNSLFFFEADMRPNVWIEHAKFFDEDPAIKIKRYFEQGEALTKNRFTARKGTSAILAYAPRLRYRDILRNKYRCWFYHSDYFTACYLLRRTAYEIKKWFIARCV